ncbi:hypothetical protein EKO04_001042 [Ascochyta lentis]|uniref:Integral membrane protein n=1 Tax=Ascochyta lentis TaxID=205686 RepID=A0A8H7MI16_9PLEO|nr:hypothetical protein EKO04_001042 [Ascochyta lentis]
MHFSARTIAGVAAFITITILYTINAVSARDPTSFFFNPRKGYAARYSAIRRQQAEDFLQAYHDAPSHEIVKAGHERNRKLCVGIPSFKREGVRYLRDTVGSLLEGLTPEERQEMYIIVFIPHSNPNVHPEYNEAWLPGLADQVLTYEFGDDQMQHIRNMERQGGLYVEKALFDYRYLLSACTEQFTPYIAMVEDDVVAMDGWYHRTMAAISEAEQQAAERHARADFLYLRLFYTEEFFGWNAEDWRSYLYYSLWVASIPTAILLFVRCARPTTKLSLTITTPRAVAAIYAVLGASILIFFGMGRNTVLPLPTGVAEMSEFGCCAQAFVFPHLKALALIEYFKDRRLGFVDVLTEDYANERRELRYAMTPGVMQHIGKKSSKIDDYGPQSKWGRSVAEKIWSFTFERFDWIKLRQEHENSARERREAKMEKEAQFANQQAGV